jgi:hypothetical protein
MLAGNMPFLIHGPRRVNVSTKPRGFSQTFYRKKLYETELGFKDLEDFLQGFWEKWALSKGRAAPSQKANGITNASASRPRKPTSNGRDLAERRRQPARAIRWQF